MPDTGFQLVGTGTSVDTGANAAWANPGNITADDGVAASWSYFSGTPAESDTLKGSNCGFAIPSNATIVGVEVKVKLARAIGSTVSYVNIGKDDSTLGTQLTPGTAIAGTLTEYTFGGPTSLFGLSLAPSDVNSSNFQARIRVSSSADIVTCDAMWVRVYYTLPELYPDAVPSDDAFHAATVENENQILEPALFDAADVFHAPFADDGSGYDWGLTAGTYTDGIYGYATADGLAGADVGSITNQPYPGETLDYFLWIDGSGVQIAFRGDATAALAGYVVHVDGTPYPFDAQDWNYNEGANITLGVWSIDEGPVLEDGASYACALVPESGDQDLGSGIYVDVDAIYVAAVEGGDVEILPPFFEEEDEFYEIEVVPEGQYLEPALFTSADAFHAATVALVNDLTPALVPADDIFYVPQAGLPLRSTGWRIAGTGRTIDTGGGVTWGNPGRVTADDNSQSSAIVSDTTETDTLCGSNFGFTIPDKATIVGVAMRAQIGVNILSGTASYSYANIGKDDSTLGTARTSDVAVAGLTPVNHDDGDAESLWDFGTITPAEANSADFQARVRCKMLTGIGGAIFGVDAIWMQIWYLDPPVEPPFYVEADTFHQALAHGLYSLSAPNFIDTDTFHSPTVAATNDLTTDLFSDGDAVFPADVYNPDNHELFPSLFGAEDVIYEHVARGEAKILRGPLRTPTSYWLGKRRP